MTVILYVLVRPDLVGALIFFATCVELTVLVLVNEPGFDNWQPSSLGGRALHKYCNFFRWVRYGPGGKWIFGAIGLVLMSLVIFGIVWAMVG